MLLVSHWLIFLISCINFELNTSFDLLSLLSGISGSSSHSSKKHDYQPVSDDKAAQYLQNFGYVQPSSMLQSSSGFAADLRDVKSMLSSAIRKFQEFAELEPTGKLDAKTKTKMAEPRCGVIDVRAISTTREAAFKWRKSQLTYAIESYSPDLGHDQIRKAIQQAFHAWSEVVPLDFTEVDGGNENADIKIRFASHNHGDPWPFDGQGGVLAHATMPTSGLLHFDEDENWVYMDAEKIAQYGYVDILAVAIHETGHTLGLEHSRDKTSIMAPFYQETVDSRGNYIMPTLKSDDIEAIQDIYGRRKSPPPSDGWSSNGDRGRGHASWSRWGSDSDDWSSGRSHGRATTLSWRESPTTTRKSSWWDRLGGLFGGGDDDDEDKAMDRNNDDDSWTRRRTEEFETPASSGGSGSSSDCPHSLDAFSTGLGGVNYIFQGSKVYELRGSRVVKTHSLRTLFPNGPIYVEAAFANKRSNTMMLFQSYQIYAFHKKGNQFVLDGNFPKRIPSDMGFNPTGAILWNDGHQLLFSSSGDFAVYDEYWNQATTVNKISNYFQGFPDGVKGGFADNQGIMTLFTAARVLRYDASRKISMGTGQTLSQYLNC